MLFILHRDDCYCSKEAETQILCLRTILGTIKEPEHGTLDISLLHVPVSALPQISGTIEFHYVDIVLQIITSIILN